MSERMDSYLSDKSEALCICPLTLSTVKPARKNIYKLGWHFRGGCRIFGMGGVDEKGCYSMVGVS